MLIVLEMSGADLEMSVLDRDDFRHFAVAVSPEAELAPGDVFGGVVRVESADQVWVDQDWLRTAADCEIGERADALAAMLDFARRSGWVDPRSGEIAAHVERRS